MENSEDEVQNGFELPFHLNEILPNPNQHKIHRKPLMNAENMIKKGKFKSALEIYLRTVSKFPEPEIRAKLNQIIQELENFLQKADQSYIRKSRASAQEKQELDLQEKDFSNALKELSDDLTRSLKEGLDHLEAIRSELPEEVKQLTEEKESKTSEEEKITEKETKTQEKEQITEKESIASIIIATAPLEGKPASEIPLSYSVPEVGSPTEKAMQNLNQIADSLKNFPKIETLNETKPESQKLDVVVTTSEGKTTLEDIAQREANFQNLLEKLNLGLQGGLPAAEWKPRSETSDLESSSSAATTRSALEILTELYHAEEWKPFRHLPLVDRRSGKDRRTKNIPVQKERRSGIERRKVDLFKQREDFLKNWSAQIQANFPNLGIGTVGSSEGSLSPSEYKPTDFGIVGMPENWKEGEFVPSYIPIGLPSGIHSRLDEAPKVDQNSITQAPPIPETSIPKFESIPANREYIKEGVTYSPYEVELVKIGLPEPQTIHLENFADAPKRNIAWELPVESALQKVLEREPTREISEKEFEELKNLTTQKVLFPTIRDETVHELFKIELPEPIDTKVGKTDDIFGTPGAMPKVFEDTPPPDVEIVESDVPPPEQELEIPAIEAPEKEPEPERMIHGILELKPPEVDDAPFLTLTYDFSKIPHSFRLSKNYSLMEYSYYKYKPMLMKAQEFARRKMLKNALNYYRVIKSQNIPPELKKMINRNILDITEFLEKYLMSKGG